VAVDPVETDLVEAVLEDGFDVWCFVVLYGFAAGARLIVPSAFAGDGAGCFVSVAAVSIA
jgi:hypothetical protein